MEKELKELLAGLEEKQNARMQEISKINEDIERVDLKEKNSIERFEEGMESDIAAGLYMNTTEGKLQKMIDEEKNKILEESKKEKEQLAQKLEEAKKQDEIDRADEYNQIRASISDYHFKMGMEVVKAERDLKDMQAERDNKMADIDKLISEKEAQYTHLIMKNRNSMDIEMTQAAANIRQLRSELDDLNAEKATLSNEFGAKIAEQEQYIQDCNAKKDRAAKFIGQIKLSTKSIKEIYQILFEEEINKIESKEDAEGSKTEDAKAEEAKTEDEKSEKAENEAENDEKSKPNTEKIFNSDTTNNSKQGFSKQEAYNILEKEAMDKLQSITAMDYKELEEIQKNEENVKKIIEIYQNKELSSAEKEAAIIDYYMNIDTKLDIEVHSKGISINGELGEEAIYISGHGNDNEKDKEFIDGLISKYIGDGEIECDRNIIIAIAGEHYRENEDGTRELAASAEKKLKAYVDMVKNPSNENKEKCSVTYDLRKMSMIRRILSKNSWSNESVKYIEEMAYKAKDTYANVKTGPITKAKWAIKDMIERSSRKKMSSGEKVTEVEGDSQQTRKTAHTKWTEKFLGNPGKGNFTKQEEAEKPKEEMDIGKIQTKLEKEAENLTKSEGIEPGDE